MSSEKIEDFVKEINIKAERHLKLNPMVGDIPTVMYSINVGIGVACQMILAKLKEGIDQGKEIGITKEIRNG